MVRILREHEVAKHFSRMAKKANKTDIAVPFWGNGAIAALGLKGLKYVRIVCNLYQPGCNAEVIGDVLELGIKVKTHPRLHAKIYVTPQAAIVGSSNASTNGLTDEGSATKGWIEANVASEDQAFVAEVQGVFDEVWKAGDKVDEAAVKRAIKNRPPPTPHSVKATTLLAACREKPSAFANVFVAPYEENLSPEASGIIADVKKNAVTQKATKPAQSSFQPADFKRAVGWQFGGLDEGIWLIGLDCRKNKARFAGTYRTTGLQYEVEDQATLDVTLRGQITIDGRRFRISAAEKKQLESVGPKVLKAEMQSLAKVIKMIDRKPAKL